MGEHLSAVDIDQESDQKFSFEKIQKYTKRFMKYKNVHKRFTNAKKHLSVHIFLAGLFVNTARGVLFFQP